MPGCAKVLGLGWPSIGHWVALSLATARYNPYMWIAFSFVSAIAMTLIGVSLLCFYLVEELQRSFNSYLWHSTMRTVVSEFVHYLFPWHYFFPRQPLAIADESLGSVEEMVVLQAPGSSPRWVGQVSMFALPSIGVLISRCWNREP